MNSTGTTAATGTDIADKIAIAELIQAWGVCRDQGKWRELRGTFTPEGHISVSWFRGPFEHFVEQCRASAEAGHSWSRHHLFTPTIKLNGDRAVVETPVIIRVRQAFKSVPVDLTSCSRFLDRVERHDGGWLIAERAAIYERDRLDPVEPSRDYEQLFKAGGAARFPEEYRYMAFRLAHAPGRTLAPVVYRDRGPETADLYARFTAWLAGEAA
jgi:SnoaL-like protein